MNIQIAYHVENIIKTFHQNGYQAYVVGGAVRDALMGLPPCDWDIATDASPEQTQRLFPKHFDTGLKHGTVTVLSGGKPVEVTTYRIDGEYNDNRRPDFVTFSKNLEDDLSRRDFTVNAMAYNSDSGLVDPFGGRKDIEKKLIKTVGDADRRFGEDALRMLRAIRFCAKLNFDIDGETLESIKNNAKLLNNISSERINSELTKFLMAGNKTELLTDSGVCRVILPELYACFFVEQNNIHHIYNVGKHTMEAVKHAPCDIALKYAILLHDIGKAVTKTTDKKGTDHFYGHGKASVKLAGDILSRLKFDNKTKSEILLLIDYHDRQIDLSEKAVKRVLAKIGERAFEKLLLLKKADAYAQNPIFLKDKSDHIDNLEKIYLEITEKKHPFHIKDLAINGHDLIELGYSGKKIGEMMNFLFDKVLEEPSLNTKETLITIAENVGKPQ